MIFFFIVYALAALFIFTFPKVSYELAKSGWDSREAQRAKEEEEEKKLEAEQKEKEAKMGFEWKLNT